MNGARFVQIRASENSYRLHQLDAVVLQRNGPYALPGRCEVGIQHRGSCETSCALADPTPEPAGRHNDRLDFRHLCNAQRVVTVEVILLDASVLERALLKEQRGKSEHGATRDLTFDLSWIHRISRIDRDDHSVHLHYVPINRNLGQRSKVACRCPGLRQPPGTPIALLVAPAALLGDRIENGT